MSMIHLGGALVASSQSETTAENMKRAMLCYAGKFASVDGDVEITADHLAHIVERHNGKIERLKESIRMSDYPPVQLDHSTSARDTVGRLMGPLELGEHDGNVALFGHVKILGADNWERVLDGRWTHLSIGADLESGELMELTITPFPAARNAILLTSKGANMVIKETDEEMKKRLAKEEEDKAKLSADGDEDDKTKLGDEKITIEHDADGDGKLPSDKLASEEEEDKAKLSAEEEDEEKKKEEDEKSKTELSAAITSMKKKTDAVRLALRKTNLAARFTRLRAQAKVTPAELKKIDFVKLAAANDVTIEAVVQSYENREPVIRTGQLGTIKAMSAAELSKKTQLTQLEQECRANMSSVRNNGVKLSSEGTEEIGNRKPVEEVAMSGDSDSAWTEIVKAIGAGDEEGAKNLFRAACKMNSGGDVAVDETEMASLMSAFADLESNFSSVVRLTSARMGVQL
jgi:hypothetical protein